MSESVPCRRCCLNIGQSHNGFQHHTCRWVKDVKCPHGKVNGGKDVCGPVSENNLQTEALQDIYGLLDALSLLKELTN